MSVYSDLEKRVLRLVNTETTIPARNWLQEAEAIKTQARKAYAMRRITHDEMCRLIKMVMEVEDEELGH